MCAVAVAALARVRDDEAVLALEHAGPRAGAEMAFIP
jgi:hypothetical protein